MKTLLNIILISCCSIPLMGQSQAYTNFEWDIPRIGIAVPTNQDKFDGGATFGTELRYNLKDNLSIGLLSQVGAMVSSEAYEKDKENVDVGLSHFIALTSDYYFSANSPRRGFIGLGFGNYSTGTVEFRDEDSNLVEDNFDNTFGLMPRIGYELGHFRIEAQYNLPFKEEALDYFGVSIALTLWGGYQGR